MTLFNALVIFSPSAQTLRKLERAGTNSTHPTLVNGDTIQRFTTSRRRPSPKPNRLYYWQSQDHILRTLGAYNGYLLDGPYQLTDRTDRLLGSGIFKQGLKTGLWRRWRADGSLLSSSRWYNGVQRGSTISYDVNSQPLRSPNKVVPEKAPAPSATAVTSPSHWWQFRRRHARRAPLPGTPASIAPPASGVNRVLTEPKNGPKKPRRKPKQKEVPPAAPPEAAPKPRP